MTVSPESGSGPEAGHLVRPAMLMGCAQIPPPQSPNVVFIAGRVFIPVAGLLLIAAQAGAQSGERTLPTPQSVPTPLPAQVPAGVPTPASVTGTVMDSGGALVMGAHVRLTSGTTLREAVSDDSGTFQLRGVPPGAVDVAITLPGFATYHQELTLLPGQDLQLAPAVLQLATVSVEVDAITSEELALQQLKEEEHQRLIGVLPNFFVSYNWTAPPLTARQKFSLATHNVLDPGNLALVGTVAGVQQATNAFPGYHQGAAGYGKRYGADLGNLVIGTYMGGAVLPSLFRQDPRYFYKGTGSLRSRALYAMSRAVICRGDNGRDQPNFSGVLGDLSSGAISNLYYPASDRQGATLTVENGLLSIAGDVMNNLVQEFVLEHLTRRGKAKTSTGVGLSAKP